MSDAASFIVDLTPTATLLRLARLVDASAGALGELAAAGVGILPATTASLDTRVALVFPAPAAAAADRLRALIDGLAGSLDGAHAEVEVGRLDRPPIPLAAGIGWLLLASASTDDRAAAEPGHLLVVRFGLDLPTAARCFEELRFHATHTAFASFGARPASSHADYAFHLRDDDARGSSVEALVASEGLRSAEILRPYRAGPTAGLVFLPAGAAVGRRALAAADSILRQSPGAFGLDPATLTAPRLLAIVRVAATAGGMRLRLVPLAGLEFHDEALVALRAGATAELEVVKVRGEGVRASLLAAEIARLGPRFGRRLELRPVSRGHGGHAGGSVDAGDGDEGEAELDRLREELDALQHRFDYLRSLRRPRRTLLRFTRRQLPALADAVSCFARTALAEGQVRYGFQATTAHDRDDAWHYLLFDPSAAPFAEPFVATLWSDLDEPPIEFELDPFWSLDYHDGDGTSLLFVPRGSALSPPLHGWDAGGGSAMDDYLRARIRNWFEGRAGATALPVRPLYVFEPMPGARAADRLRVQVLDEVGLAPLKERLGWINQNLELAQSVEVEELIAAAAERVSRERMLAGLKQRQGVVTRLVERRAGELGEALGAEAAAHMGRLAAELERLSDSAQAVLTDATRARERLERLRDVAGQLDGAHERLNARLGEQVDEQRGAYRRLLASTDEVRRLLAEVEEARGKLG